MKGVLKGAEPAGDNTLPSAIFNAPTVSNDYLELLEAKRKRSREEQLIVDKARYMRALGSLFNEENIEKAIKQDLLAAIRHLDYGTNWSDSQRAAYDASTRGKGKLTFTDASHRTLKTSLVQELLGAANLELRSLALTAKQSAAANTEVEISSEQLAAIQKKFCENVSDYNTSFNTRITKPESTDNQKKIWDSIIGNTFHLPLVKKKRGPKGQQVAKYYIDIQKIDLVLEILNIEG